MTFTATIKEDCYVQYCNGPGTPKELITFVSYEEQDDEGPFEVETQIVVPVPYDTDIGPRPDLEGKTLTITIA